MTFDPTKTTEMLVQQWADIDRWVDDQLDKLTTPDPIEQLETQVRRLHAWVTFCVVLVLGMTAITIVALLQLGGWIRWFA